VGGIIDVLEKNVVGLLETLYDLIEWIYKHLPKYNMTTCKTLKNKKDNNFLVVNSSSRSFVNKMGL